MDVWVWILIAVAAILVIAAVVFGFVRRRQRRELRDWFGPEYDRTRRGGEKPSGGRRRARGTRRAG